MSDLPPADWFPDPSGQHEQRYWDGSAWTEHVFTDGVQGVDPLPGPGGDRAGAADDGVGEVGGDGDDGGGADPSLGDAAADDGDDDSGGDDVEPVTDGPPATPAAAVDPDPASRPRFVDAPEASSGLGPGRAPTSPPPATGGVAGLRGDLLDGSFGERATREPAALQNSRLLRCHLGGRDVLARQGTMVAYQGEMDFDHEGAGGVGRALKRAATGEGVRLMRVRGRGDLFLADEAKHVFLLHLDGGPGLCVNGRSVLAFSDTLTWSIDRVQGANVLAGGLFTTTLRGSGWCALVADGEPVVLRTEEAPTHVDVNALVAWSADLTTRVVSSVKLKAVAGFGSGEAVQVAFDGRGVVVVQPSEGPSVAASSG